MKKNKVLVFLLIIGVCIITMLVGLVLLKGRQNTDKIEINVGTGVSSEKEISDVLVFDKSGTIFKLYNRKNEILDELDLTTLSFEKNKILPKETTDSTFTNFRTIENELIFRDDSKNFLILIGVEDEKITAKLLLKDVDLEKLTDVYLTEKHIYLTFDEDTQITQISKIKTNDKKHISKIDIGKVPNHIAYKDGYLYFSTLSNEVGRYNTSNENIEFVEIGDVALDIYVEKDFLYVINQFGKEKEDSVLMKIDTKEFTTKDILSLKGINSKFINIEDNIAYIRQKESVKQIDLLNLRIIKSFVRKEGNPVQVKNNVLYELKDGKMIVLDIKDKVEVLEVFECDGFNLYLTN